jgi:pimeloyl-ACP methyl ester carboxylesterase
VGRRGLFARLSTICLPSSGRRPPLAAEVRGAAQLQEHRAPGRDLFGRALDRRTPHTRVWLASLSERYRLVRFDARGHSLSSRDVADVSFDRFVDDLECVFDATGVDRAPIFAISRGCAIAAAFAARAPERVSGIVMLGGYPPGRLHRPSPKSRAEADALRAMIDAGWDDPYPSLRDLMSDRIVPLASVEERRAFAEDMRQMCSAEMLVRYRDALEGAGCDRAVARGPRTRLVLHCLGDRMQPIEQGQLLAAGIRMRGSSPMTAPTTLSPATIRAGPPQSATSAPSWTK